MSALLLQEETTKVVIHTMPLFHILDHHSRRQDDRVIGTLLGRKEGRTIEVTNCFSIPHKEQGDEVAIGKDFDRKMLSMHLRCNKNETVVGWYASGGCIADTSYLIHDFYAGQTEDGDPIHIVVDTTLDNKNGGGAAVPMKAYKSAPVLLQGESLANVFHEIKLTMKSTEPETICLHEMIRGGTVSNEPLALQSSMEKLYKLLESTLDYVDSVVDGSVPADEEKGRHIADTLATVPRVRPEVFDEMFHDSLQDLLMVTYLSNITRTQLEVAEKLNATLGTV